MPDNPIDDGLIGDMADDADRQLEASKPRPNGSRAGLEDILVQRNQGNGFNPIKEVISGSENPAEYWVRTNLTPDEIMDDVLRYGEMMWAIEGYIDTLWTMKAEYHLRRAANGAAMNMMADMYTGQQRRQENMFTGAVRGGILRRANTINNEQIEPSS